ncbi:DUF882 domain-containing protein [Vibrio sp. V27_P1S3P104]|nr:DUF882 domain-containing protein [Vibrio sp. V28_P6S34P95]NAX03634.1 DUF882 domain-containing protein [Vibrio sp. V30_P3S12P165]NAX34246.1 DUF882 domain-containing protein [Vibrio sp. V29_P1S30P107]NAX38146.1 DUF882 domain-containing protein [Vibrio sp. V27_P1S3P104]
MKGLILAAELVNFRPRFINNEGLILHLSRRRFLQLTGLGAASAAVFPSFVHASLPQEPRVLMLNNPHTGESLESCYFNGHRYVRSELQRLNHLCRDFRRNEVYPMDKQLFDQLSRIQALLGTAAKVEIISGYRSPATNKMLLNHSRGGVAKKSLHMLGQAIDFRLEGVELSLVHTAALKLQAGGVGYYPKSHFIHIDTGLVRQWRGA